MRPVDRRSFLKGLSSSMAALMSPDRIFAQSTAAKECWLRVCVPVIIEDPASNTHTDIILTSATFDGLDGYRDSAHATDYELRLYDAAGNEQPIDGASKLLRLTVPAMRTTVIPCSQLLRSKKSFWGAMSIKVWSKGRSPLYTSDLFSAAYARWNFSQSFDTLHAHPDPLQFQTHDRFFSSMPFPSLEEFQCALSLFNPYETPSSGRIIVYSPEGSRHKEIAYNLAPFGSTLLDLNEGRLSADMGSIISRPSASKTGRSGSLTIENDEAKAKNFAYMIIRGKTGNSIAAEHTIHQTNYQVIRASSPFGADQSFRPRGWVYSCFIFNRVHIGGLDLSSRVYLGAGRPLEDEMWLLAYTTDAEGNLQWTTRHDEGLGALLPRGFLSQGAIRLRPFQSCDLDCERLSLKKNFAGGIGIATSPQTSHVLMKVEVRIHNWSTAAFSHFRPGARSGRMLEGVRGRGGLASDYIVTGARLIPASEQMEADSLLGIFNLDQDTSGAPVVEAFNKDGFLARKSLGEIPGWGCRHILLSSLFPELVSKGAGPMTLRLYDRRAVVILSAMHIDYKRRDVAIDHGSDRFSTVIDYGCV
ncbi:MAG: hypothetical protein AB1631_17185 [Acidobacteriota bacterium]